MSTHVDDKKNSVFKVTLNLAMASLISGAIIAFVFFITAPVAAEQRIIQRDKAMSELMPGASGFEKIPGQEGWYLAKKDGKSIGWVIPSVGRGYGGKIKMLLAVAQDMSIIGYKILAHNETPGFGDKSTKGKFRDQFAGKKVNNLEVVKIHEEGKIDAITGATITSRAVTKAIRESLTQLIETQGTQGSAP